MDVPLSHQRMPVCGSNRRDAKSRHGRRGFKAAATTSTARSGTKPSTSSPATHTVTPSTTTPDRVSPPAEHQKRTHKQSSHNSATSFVFAHQSTTPSRDSTSTLNPISPPPNKKPSISSSKKPQAPSTMTQAMNRGPSKKKSKKTQKEANPSSLEKPGQAASKDVKGQTAVQAPISKGTRTKACHFGSKCHNPTRKFVHPTVPKSPQVPPPTEAQPTPSPAIAKLERSVRNALEQQQQRTQKQANSPSLEKPVQAASKDVKGQTAVQAPISKGTKTKACHFGSKCHNPTCEFVHPTVPRSPHVPPPTGTEAQPTRAPEIAKREDEERSVRNALEQQQRTKKLSPLRRAQEEAARILLQQEEQELDDLLKEQELQRLVDAEDLARGAPAVYKKQQQQQLPLMFQGNTAPSTATKQSTGEAMQTTCNPMPSQQAPPPTSAATTIKVVPAVKEARTLLPAASRCNTVPAHQTMTEQPSSSVRRAAPQQAPHNTTTASTTKSKQATVQQQHTAVRHKQDPSQSAAQRIIVAASTYNTAQQAPLDQIPLQLPEPSGAAAAAEVLAGQLQQMRDMGFHDEQATVKALQESGGDLNAAVELLLLRPPAPSAAVVAPTGNESVLLEDKASDDRIRFEHEEAERQKAARKAAKKERQRLQKEAKACAQMVDSTVNSSVEDNVGPVDKNEDDDAEQKKLRWREELRLQKERAVEKKEEKKNRRREQLCNDLKRQTEERAEFWKKSMDEEQQTIGLIAKLCVSEFCRVHKILDQRSVLEDGKAGPRLLEAGQAAYRVLYPDSVLGRAVVVKGMKQVDLNERTGVIEHWDEDMGKFCVGLATKKGKQRQLMFFLPGNIEVLANDASNKSQNKNSDSVYMVKIVSLFSNLNLVTGVCKSDIDCMKKAYSADDFLVALMQQRQEDERLAKERDEKDRRQEEQARQRHARQREQEQKEWEDRQRWRGENIRRQQEESRQHYAKHFEKGRKEWEDRKRQYMYEKETNQRCPDSGHRLGECLCAECMYKYHLFLGSMGGQGFRGFLFRTMFGGNMFFSYVEDDDDDYEDEGDWQWNRPHDETSAEEDQEAADLLGVSVDASADEIKRVFRKKALKYHPDKFRTEHHEDGTTKDEAENHFKELNSAYTHLMSRLLDD